MVSSLLNERMLSGRLQESSFVRRIAGHTLGRTVRRQLRPGASLPLLGDRPSSPPDWAGASPIGVAYAALRDAAGAGGALLNAPARELVLSTISGWDGSTPPLVDSRLEELLATLSASDRPGARLALLAALDPHRIIDADVATWRTNHPNEADLVRLLAFGAMSAVDGIQEWISVARQPSEELTAIGACSPSPPTAIHSVGTRPLRWARGA